MWISLKYFKYYVYITLYIYIILIYNIKYYIKLYQGKKLIKIYIKNYAIYVTIRKNIFMQKYFQEKNRNFETQIAVHI